MKKYIYLATALPELEIGKKPDISFQDFIVLCRENLSKKDWELVVDMRFFYDIVNIRNFWQGEAIDPYGNYDVLELEDALLTHAGLPKFVYAYMDKYPQKNERIHHFPELFAEYFTFIAKEGKNVAKRYFKIERDLRLILTAFRAKALDRDLIKELQYEDPEDPLIQQILAFKDSKYYEPPEPYEDLSLIFQKYKDSPLELYKELVRYRFKKVEELYGVDVFSLDRILGYMVQLILVEGWLELDQTRGRQIVETIIKGT